MPPASLQLRDGVPRKDECDAVLQSAAFREMDTFSTDFLEMNRGVLAGYNAKWGADNPLHSWSRQWEYPYVFGKVAEVVRARPRARILDAGSGATFMPFYLRRCFEGTTVACCDTDDTLTDVFASLNGNMKGDVEFSAADIRELPYRDRSFDLIYCVSVLEHTDSYEDILNEFSRVSNGAGMAITFDVGLDGTRDMRMEDLDRLLKALETVFDEGPDHGRTVKRQLSNPDILTTRAVDPRLLPWRGPPLLHRLKSSLANRRLVPWPPLLTVCCLSGGRSADPAAEC
ncbi:MAG: class I SAM-dependent methyltransferase [Gemmatimonadota bacterium]|nr:class I SAM-dependent methyltransferase [Gemmatimonadota bacterium]MDE2983467.1 class I SAM-dependent methyltransferase [Gemmatimonadota bacterium]